ncbi:MAG TPA: DNA primase [Steroidobacteraceae bacterium]|jgi:DNA primase|nr:DNA primase [Steroidobacteraceae bacterium]
MNGRIPQGFIDEVIARSDIVEIVGARVPLKKAGREYKACCPFHGEKTPSFCVSPDKQFYHCFGCGAHGTAIGFLMQYEKMEFLDAVADLAQRAGLEVPREARAQSDSAGPDLSEVLQRIARFYEQNLKDNDRAKKYAAARGLDAQTCARFTLGYAPDSWDAVLNRFGADESERRQLRELGMIIERDTRGGERAAGFYDRFRDRLMFPIRDSRGRVIGFGGRIIDQGEPKYLNSPETPLFHKGRELYGLYEARQARADFRRLMVVEGYMDVVRLHQAGVTYAVATLGTATTPEHLGRIFRQTREVVFCFDGDRAGRQAAWRALENSLPLALDGREIKFMFLPDGHDPDTLVAEEGAGGFEERLQGALPLSEYLIQHLSSEVDLDHVDGRAKLKNLAAPLFARLPEGVYREILADALARRVGMPSAALKKSFQAGDKGERPRRGSEPVLRRHGRMSVGRGNLLTQAIALVLHHPAAAKAVKDLDVLDAIDRPGVGVLKDLLIQAGSAASPTTAMLLERFRGLPEYDRLSELAMAEPLVAESQAAGKELLMAVQKMHLQWGPGRRMDELLKKAEETGLNYDEKAELSTLLKSKGDPRVSP